MFLLVAEMGNFQTISSRCADCRDREANSLVYQTEFNTGYDSSPNIGKMPQKGTRSLNNQVRTLLATEVDVKSRIKIRRSGSLQFMLTV